MLDFDDPENSRTGLLPSSYYDGSRQSLFNRLLMDFESNSLVEIEVFIPLNEIEMVREHYLAFMEIVKKQYSYYEGELRKCFIPFTKTGYSKIVNDQVVVGFNHGSEYVLSKVMYCSFLYHKGYNSTEYINKILNDYDFGVLREVDYFPSRESGASGQLKIAVDAILALDAVENKENIKVLIVGSSHEPMVKPKSSYASLAYMMTGEIHMYDPLEEEGRDIIGDVTVVRHRSDYKYDDVESYDLVLDDAWSSGLPVANEFDFSNVANFSVKSFSESVVFNNYYQTSHTDAHEIRVVSRSLVPDYNCEERLGMCVYCTELKYMLRNKYVDDMYYAFYSLHPEGACKNRGYFKFRQRSHIEKSKMTVVPVAKIPYVLRKGEQLDIRNRQITLLDGPLRRVYYDDWFRDIPVVELRADHLMHVYLVLTQSIDVTSVMMLSKGIYVVTDKGLMFVVTRRLHISLDDKSETYADKQKNKRVDRVNRTPDKRQAVSGRIKIEAVKRRKGRIKR